MEYKRSYAGEVVGIIAIIIGAFIAVVTIQSPPRTGDSYNDRLEQLNSEMKEERLNERPRMRAARWPWTFSGAS